MAVHTGAVTQVVARQSSMCARPVVPDCISSRFWLLSAISRLLSAFFRLLWQPFPFALNFFLIALCLFQLLWQSFPFALNFSRLLCAFSDCSSSCFRLLSNLFRLLSTFSKCSGTFSDCSLLFPITQQLFPIAPAGVSVCWTNYFYVIHLNVTTAGLLFLEKHTKN